MLSTPPAAFEVSLRKIGRTRDADLCVRGGHLAFGLGDVRAALEQRGRQPGIDRRRHDVERQSVRRQAEERGVLADQDRDGMLGLRPLQLDSPRPE